MKALKIKAYDAIPSPGDFKAKISGDNLLLPECIAVELLQNERNTPEAFLSALNSFPEWIGAILNWKPDEVAKADVLLRQQLKDHIDPGYLAVEAEMKKNPPRFKLGARLAPGRFGRKP